MLWNNNIRKRVMSAINKRLEEAEAAHKAKVAELEAQHKITIAELKADLEIAKNNHAESLVEDIIGKIL